MNAAYDHDEHALPSVLHRQRAKEHGEWVGFNSRPYHWICENRMHDEAEGWGYSCLTMIDKETIGILYESSVAHITFQAIKLTDIIKE